VVDVPPAEAFAPIRRIGGGTGWYFGNSLWRVRGWIDRVLGGAGMPKMRRDPDDCLVDDTIDGWRVEAYVPNRVLRLSAGLKLPGRGWLEFRVDPLNGGERSLIRQTATFDPRGIAGRLYWYGVLPLHALVFSGLLRRIVHHAERNAAPAAPARFSFSSIVNAPAEDVFRWHEQPGALSALTPAGLIRIEQQEGGIRNGGRVTVSAGVGRARMYWTMLHHGYMDGRQFCDEQVRGPFAVWRHEHLFEPIGPSQTLYEDRLEFAATRHGALNRLAAAALRPALTLVFAYRHRIVRAGVDRARRRVARRWTAAAAVVAAVMLQSAAAHAQLPVRAIPFVDLNRYLGDWYEIARLPNRFQRECVGDVRATYTRRPDGLLDVMNRCRTAEGETEARGVARVVDERAFSKLKVRFAPAWLSWLSPVWGDYWIIGLAPDYSWAVVGEPGRNYLWILSRTPRLDEASIAAAHSAARAGGYTLERIVMTPQTDAGQ
jgi:apolipoprotein D and lipocalin family protein